MIKIEVFDHDDFLGSIELYMNDLLDQQKYEGWFFLGDDQGKETFTQIRLRFQFIWSRYLYFHEKCEKAQTNLEKLNSDIQEINRYLELFNKPYGLIYYAEILEVLNKKVFEEQEENYSTVPRKSIKLCKKAIYNLKKKNTVHFFSKHDY